MSENARFTLCPIDQLPIEIVDVDRRLALAQDDQATSGSTDPEFRVVEPLVAIEWLPAA